MTTHQEFDPGRRVMNRPLSVVVLLGLLAMLALGTLPPPAAAHCVSTEHNNFLHMHEDRFRNFDYDSHNDDRCNVDWPINFLYWNNASAAKVKNQFGNHGWDREPNSRKFGLVDDGGGFVWEGDEGIKTFSVPDCLSADMEHQRIYGAIYNDNHMYNLSWGSYVLATSHIDHRECSGGWSGNSELAEHRIAEDARHKVWNPERVCGDCVPFYNHLEFRVADDQHRLRNSGQGGAVKVP